MFAHVVGSLLGGCVTGLLLGAVGAVFLFADPAARAIFAAVAAAGVATLYGVSELGFLSLPRPQSRRQVPSRWNRRYSPALAGLLYGAGLGAAVMTRVHFATLYVVLTWSLIVGRPTVSGLVMAAFGLGRVLPLLVIGPGVASDGDRLERGTRTIEMWERVVRFANGLALMALGAYLGVSILRTAGV
jgi:hypothetical protein